MKKALCIIIKDDSEAEKLDRAINSVRGEVDGIFITGTNKPDEKIQTIVKKHGGHYSYFNWIGDFSAARNFNFEQAYNAGAEWILWMDTDDQFKGKPGVLDELIEKAPAHADGYVVYYQYAKDLGYDLVSHWRERFIRWQPNRMKWVGWLHEQIITQEPVYFDRTDLFSIDHEEYAEEDLYKKLERNLGICLAELESQGNSPDPRTLIIIGRTLYGLKRYDESIEYLERYIPLSGWDEERYEALCMIGEMLSMKGDPKLAEKVFLRAISEIHNRYRAYEGLVKIYYSQGRWDRVTHWFEAMNRFREPDTFHWKAPLINRLAIKSLYVQALFLTNRCEEGMRHWQDMKKEFPDHYIIKDNDSLVKEMYDEYRLIKGTNMLAEQLFMKNDNVRLEKLLESLPRDFQYHPSILRIRHTMLPPRTHGKDEITVFCGNIGLEDWADPSTIKGIGGSEEAVINMTRRWAAMGWKVTVYNRCGKLAGTYSGVTYKPYDAANPSDKYNVFIAWRDPSPIEIVTANVKWVWMHDVPQPGQFPKSIVDKVDKIVVLSKYHRSLLSDIPDDKIYISRNGIDPKQFTFALVNRPKLVIYTSSPERGLEHFLSVAEKVTAADPNIKFEAYYGWQNNDAVRSGDPEYEAWKARINERMEKLGMPPYTRLNHKEIANRMKDAHIWFYPTEFPEISCITAMKAQAAGAWPICTNYAALDETVQFGEKVDTSKTGGEITKEHIKLFRDLILNHKPNPDKTAEMMDWAQKHFDWDVVAKEWADQWQK